MRLCGLVPKGKCREGLWFAQAHRLGASPKAVCEALLLPFPLKSSVSGFRYLCPYPLAPSFSALTCGWSKHPSLRCLLSLPHLTLGGTTRGFPNNHREGNQDSKYFPAADLVQLPRAKPQRGRTSRPFVSFVLTSEVPPRQCPLPLPGLGVSILICGQGVIPVPSGY